MSSRSVLRAAFAVAALLAAPSVLRAQSAPPASAQVQTAQGSGPKEPNASQLAARERQRRCGAEWRALPAADKVEAGPRWPQYYSKCVKRLKEQKA